MKRCIVLGLLFFVASTLVAQITNVQGLDNVVIRTKKYEDIKGTAYLYPSWSAGTLTDRNGKMYSNLLLKYDSYKDQIELNQEGQVVEVSTTNYPKFTLSWTEPGSNEVIKHSFSSGYTVPGFTKTTYFDVVYDGKMDLLKKYKTSFVEEAVTGYGTSDPQKSFQLKVYYFVLAEDGSAKEIKLSKKSILDAFPDHAETIEGFSKENKLKLKSEGDLVQVIRFLDLK